MKNTDINFNKMVRWARREGHSQKDPATILSLYNQFLIEKQKSMGKRGREATRYRLFTRQEGRGRNSQLRKVFVLNSQENRDMMQNHGWKEHNVVLERDDALLLGDIAEGPSQVSRAA